MKLKIFVEDFNKQILIILSEKLYLTDSKIIFITPTMEKSLANFYKSLSRKYSFLNSLMK